MDFSELIEAINQGNRKKTDEMFANIRGYLIRYLVAEFGATTDHAEEYSQEACAHVYEAIQLGKVQEPQKLKYYFISTCRNCYLKRVTRNKEHPDHELEQKMSSAPKQIDALIDEEQMSLLKICLKKLSEAQRTFIDYLFQHTDAETDHIADHFNLSHSNVWVKKHRIINKLKECIHELDR